MTKRSLFLLVFLLTACAAPQTATPTATLPPTEAPLSTATAAPTEPPPPTATPEALSDGAFFEQPPGTLRVMSYNVNWDSIFPLDDPMNHDLRQTGRGPQFARILQAIQPDVLCLQEISPHRDVQDSIDWINTALGTDTWTAVQARDMVIASHYPVLLDGYALDIINYPSNLPQAAALIDLPEGQYGEQDLFVICSHFESGGSATEIRGRQRQADAVMGEVADAITPGGVIDLAVNTPYILLGDFNAYDTDPAAHVDTLINGAIEDEGRYGADFAPDWDGTALADLLASVNAAGEEIWTWREDGSGFNPWPLDRIIYTDSQLTPVNAFNLDTTRLSDEALLAYGLEWDDVLMYGIPGFYDHLPMVVDFVVGPVE